jgi:PTS system ascorbate-specific IIA component
MNSIFIVAHAPLAYALRECVLHVYSEYEQRVRALDVLAHMPPEETSAAAQVSLQQLRAQSGRPGVLVLADVFGATPFNVVQKLSDGVHTRLVTGVNLPMLWSVVNRLHEPLDMLVERAVAGGQQGIIQVAATAPQNQAKRNHDQNYRDHQQ